MGKTLIKGLPRDPRLKNHSHLQNDRHCIGCVHLQQHLDSCIVCQRPIKAYEPIRARPTRRKKRG